jgi:hypothetical protein
MDFAIEAVRFLRPYMRPEPAIDRERFVSEIYADISAVRYYSRKQMLERVHAAISSKGWIVKAALRAAGVKCGEPQDDH